MKKTTLVSIIAILMPFVGHTDTVVTSKTYVDAKVQPQDSATGSILNSQSPDDKAPSSKAVYTALQSAMASFDALPPGSADAVLQYNGTNSAWESVTMDSTPTQSSVKPVTSGGVYDTLAGKQDNLGGNGNGGKVVTATDTAGTVGYTTIKTTVDTSADLITAGAVKTYADAKVSTSSEISSTSTTTAPNEKAVYGAINTVQDAVTALQSCTHTCANTACDLINVSCVDAYAGQ